MGKGRHTLRAPGKRSSAARRATNGMSGWLFAPHHRSDAGGIVRAMTDPEVQAAASEIRRNYDLCTEAILNGDPNGFVAAFGPAARGETAEGVPIMMSAVRDYVAWRMDRTVTAHSFVVDFNSVEGSGDEVWIEFTEDSSATVLDAHNQPALRHAHSTNRVLWRREDGEWNQVGGAEQAQLTVNGVEVDREGDPVGVPAYRAARSRDS
jgi:hypothetical protein